ncbi:MAG: hypothetical protein KY468_12945, partial [Armatimonadetes bacterium]|nr:hypothetical protein [Armatimonadota bacterium]
MFSVPASSRLFSSAVKPLLIPLCIVVLLALFVFSSPALALQKGDVTGEGEVNVGDAVAILRAAVRLEALSSEQQDAADVDYDGQVTVADASLLLDSVLNNKPLPAPPPVTATARFVVDARTKQVQVISLPGAARRGSPSGSSFLKAILAGARVSFNTSPLIDEPGDVGLKALNVSVTNSSGFPLGQSPSGTVTGLRALFSEFFQVYSDLRTQAQVSTGAGSGAAGSADGAALSATFGGPTGVAFWPNGDLYVADYLNHKIRRIQGGNVSTLAGSGTAGSVDASGTSASFNYPWGIAVYWDGSLIVTDRLGHKIRRVTTGGVVTTIAGTGTPGNSNGPGDVAMFNQPMGVTVGKDGNIYVVDHGNFMIRKITLINNFFDQPSSYTVTTVAGNGAPGAADGTGAAAQFSYPVDIAADEGHVLYVADYANHKVRRISPAGAVTTVAGTGAAGLADGNGNVAQFRYPGGIAVVIGTLVVSDNHTHRLRQLQLRPGNSPGVSSSWTVQSLAGEGTAGHQDGSGEAARFFHPYGLSADADGNLLVADYANNRIRRVAPNPERVWLSNPDGMYQDNRRTPGEVRPYLSYAGTVANGGTSSTKQWAFVVPKEVSAFEFDVTLEAATDVLAPPPARSGSGSPDTWVRTLAGGLSRGFLDGDASQSLFRDPAGIAVDRAGNLYVSESSNGAVRRISVDGLVTTVAGNPGIAISGSADGSGHLARFYGPIGIAVTPDGKTLYVADGYNHRIRRISLAGTDPTKPDHWTVATIVNPTTTASGYVEGSGDVARMDRPWGIALGQGGNLYVS